jgi:hypothetical protein
MFVNDVCNLLKKIKKIKITLDVGHWVEPVCGLAVVTTHHLVKSIQCPLSSTLMVITHHLAKSIQYLFV